MKCNITPIWNLLTRDLIVPVLNSLVLARGAKFSLCSNHTCIKDFRCGTVMRELAQRCVPDWILWKHVETLQANSIAVLPHVHWQYAYIYTWVLAILDTKDQPCMVWLWMASDIFYKVEGLVSTLQIHSFYEWQHMETCGYMETKCIATAPHVQGSSPCSSTLRTFAVLPVIGFSIE